MKVKLSMKRTQRGASVLILLSCGISILWSLALGSFAKGGSLDFQAVYYGSRCLIEHRDPYSESSFLKVFSSDGGEFPTDSANLHIFRRAVPFCINLPTTLLLVAPFASLSWQSARVLWLTLLAASLTLAAFLMHDLGANNSPGKSLFLTCTVLANSEILFSGGNLAGVAVSLCLIGVWCFLENRYVPAGVLCLALGLAIKPHDVGFVWLYFLLAGGVYRKRALQTLVIVLALVVPAVLWVSHVSPGWISELHSNILSTSAHGDLSDPGPTSISMRLSVRIIDLQSVISVFKDDPRFYNPVSYMVGGVLLLAWSVQSVRLRFSTARAFIALAAIVPLSMLPVYHRSYDAKLLLLTLPACAMLSAKHGLIGRLAFQFTAAGTILTGDIPSAIMTILYNKLNLDPAGICGRILTIVMMRSATLILLVMGAFYLFLYLWRVPEEAGTLNLGESSTDSATP